MYYRISLLATVLHTYLNYLGYLIHSLELLDIYLHAIIVFTQKSKAIHTGAEIRSTYICVEFLE